VVDSTKSDDIWVRLSKVEEAPEISTVIYCAGFGLEFVLSVLAISDRSGEMRTRREKNGSIVGKMVRKMMKKSVVV